MRTVEVKLPHSAADISDKGHPLKQIKTIRRGIESIILLEASVEETIDNFSFVNLKLWGSIYYHIAL